MVELNSDKRLTFVCPKCRRELTMTLTDSNMWQMLDENHNKRLMTDSQTGKKVVNPDDCMDFFFIENNIPTLFIGIDNRVSAADELNFALEEVKKGTFGLKIRVDLGGEFMLVFLWKQGERYMGVAKGIVSDIIASTHFDDAEAFANAWFNYGKG